MTGRRDDGADELLRDLNMNDSPVTTVLKEAQAELHTAVAQMAPTDDQIICRRVKAALNLVCLAIEMQSLSRADASKPNAAYVPERKIEQFGAPIGVQSAGELSREQIEERFTYIYEHHLKWHSDPSPVYLRELRDMALRAAEQAGQPRAKREWGPDVHANVKDFIADSKSLMDKVRAGSKVILHSDHGDGKGTMTLYPGTIADYGTDDAPAQPDAALADEFPELNPANYSDEEVVALLTWGYQAVAALRGRK